MKRVVLIMILALSLVLAVGAAATALPLGPEEGSFQFYGEYSVDYPPGWNVGLGYALTENFVIGGEYYYGVYPGAYGVFAEATMDSIVVKGEVLYFPLAPFVFGNVSVLYVFDFDAFDLGVGGIGNFGPWPSLFGIEVDASLSLTENLSLYGNLTYYTVGIFGYSVGVSAAF